MLVRSGEFVGVRLRFCFLLLLADLLLILLAVGRLALDLLTVLLAGCHCAAGRQGKEGRRPASYGWAGAHQ